MDHGEIIAHFDGRTTVAIVTGAGWDAPMMADVGYEFGYTLVRVIPGRGTTRLVFERDDREHARRRAEWSVNYFRTHGRWGRQQPRFQLPEYMGPRIEPLEAAWARYAVATFQDKRSILHASAVLAALIIIVVWPNRDNTAVVAPALLVGGPLVLAGAISPWLPSKRLRRYQQTVETFDLQQAVERGFIPPPPPSNRD